MDTKYNIGDILIVNSYAEGPFVTSVTKIEVDADGVLYELAWSSKSGHVIKVPEIESDGFSYNIVRKVGNLFDFLLEGSGKESEDSGEESLVTVEDIIKRLQQLEYQKAEVKVKTPYGQRGIDRIETAIKHGDQYDTFIGYYLILGE